MARPITLLPAEHDPLSAAALTHASTGAGPGASARQAAPAHTLTPGADDGQGLQWQVMWWTVRRYWHWMLACVLVALLCAGTYALLSRPVYEAVATLLIESDRNKVINLQDVYAGAGVGRELFETQVVLVDSPAVELRAIRALHLWTYPEFDPRHGSLATRLQVALGLLPPRTAPWTEDTLVQATMPQFHAGVTVLPVPGSQLVEVHFAAHDPALAALAASAMAEGYIINDRDSRFEVSQQASQWLQTKIGALRQRLDASTTALQAYRDAHGLVRVDGNTQGEDSEALHSLASELVTARVRRSQVEGVYNELMRVENADYSGVPAVLNQPQVQEARTRLAQAELRLAELGQRFGAGNPRVIEATAQLEAARDTLRRQSGTAAGALIREYQSAAAAERTLQGSMSHTRSALQRDSRAEDQVKVLERDVQTNRDLYDMFVSRVKETDISSTLRQDVARVITAPLQPDTPVRPNRARILLQGLMAGVAAGAALAWLLARLDNTLQDARTVERQLGVMVLSSVPTCTTCHPARMARAMLDQPDSVFAERMRTARTAVLLAEVDRARRIILLTSAVPDEGKSTMACNLALAHAQSGRTLLIEGDLRQPRLHDLLDLRNGAGGLTGVLAGTCPVQVALHAVEGSTLLVLPCGQVPRNPVELLLSQRFRDLLQELSARFEVIIIDSPPLALVSDALVLSTLATDVVHVVRAAFTRVPLARQALARLRQVRAPVLGILLNDLAPAAAGTCYGEPRLAPAGASS